MIDLQNESHLSEIIGKTDEYLLRIKDHLPYSNVEVEQAVHVLADWMGMKPCKPKIVWLSDATKEEFVIPKRLGKDGVFHRTARYFHGLFTINNYLYALCSIIRNEWFDYYGNKKKDLAPKDLAKSVRLAESGWSTRQLDGFINATGVIRRRFNKTVGARLNSHPWAVPIRFYAESASRLRYLKGSAKAFIFWEYFVEKQKKDDQRLLDACKKVYLSLYSILPHNNALVLVERPRFYMNSRGLHREGGYAVEFPKLKIGIYSRNGVRVPKEVAMKPAEKLKADLIIKTANAEVRREIVDKIGIDRILKELTCETLDKTADGRYQLVNLNLGDTQRWSDKKRMRPFLKMLNPSTGDWHIEGVPPHIKTVARALSWRNNVAEGELPQTLT